MSATFPAGALEVVDIIVLSATLPADYSLNSEQSLLLEGLARDRGTS